MSSPLPKKLQIKAGYSVALMNAPTGAAAWFSPLPADAAIAKSARGTHECVVLFVTAKKEVDKNLDKAAKAVKPGGLFWIAYPKKTAKIKSDLDRDTLWKHVEPLGWSGVSLVAIDDDWSAMRFRPAAEVGT